ncbi:MAG: hypothetical protein R3230_01575 [Nitrosopumilaceae archaeon]|nr:hypothetical protein [Nitrosopumilaceae archaeon]
MKKLKLSTFKPRWYQVPLFQALEKEGYRRLICIMPRRAGKDITAFNLIIRACIRKIGVYFYIFPTYSQAKKVIWDSITNDGMRFLDYIPRELVKSSNSQEMKITFTNGSILQLVGSDNIDRLVGTNPQGIVFSEYALQDPSAYKFLRPILVGNDGWALFISTPRGKNFFYDLYKVAQQSDDWFAYKLTVEETKHISLEAIEKERQEGLMSDELIQQEYYCSFERGVEGGYYTKYIDKMRTEGRICQVPWEPDHRVHTAWDLGMRDATSIIFFQTIGTTIRFIDYYENTSQGLEHYARFLQQKPYTYGTHIAPHDIKVRELGTGMTRLDKARQLGISFDIAPDLPIVDGIEAGRSLFAKLYIDDTRCIQLIKALENYRKEYDAKKQVYKPRPLHNWASHAADCFRYLALSLPKTSDGLSAQELDQRYAEAMGGHHHLPPLFR